MTKKGGKRCTLITACFFIVVIISLCAGLIYMGTKKDELKCQGDEVQLVGTMAITKSTFGEIDGKVVNSYTLKNTFMEVKIINYGAAITNILMPDKNGKMDDITLGFDNIEGYMSKDNRYFGCIVGRYANRIAKGKFTLDGVPYTLSVNNGPNTNHGGIKGFDQRLWGAEIRNDSLVMTYTSEDGEEGFPGEVSVTVTYRLTEQNELVIDYRGTTSKATVINLTNHANFNLAGHASGTIDQHMIRLDSDFYTPLDNTSIPTGEIKSVAGTMFDLRTDARFGTRLPQVPGDTGFDINFALGRPGWDKHVARVRHPDSGRTLDMYSTEPGVQLYTAYYVDNIPGKAGAVYNRYGAFCLEAQHYPDSPNEPRFPTTILRPGEEYKQTTKYVFGMQDS